MNGGALQGTLLGNYLFIVTTDEIELSDSLRPARPVLPDQPVRECTPLRTLDFAPISETRMFSTPTVRGQFQTFDPPSPGDGVDESLDFVFFHPGRNMQRRIDDTDPVDQSLSTQNLNAECPRPDRWVDKLLGNFK